MKIGILTFPNSTSYGAVLQMYALYRAVEKLGHEAEIINYQNTYMKAEGHTQAIRRAGALHKKLRLWARRIVHVRQTLVFRRFEKKMAMHPEHPFSDPKKLAEISRRYQKVICGSDQVWNPGITQNDMSYFLDFCGEKTERVSYAPSFGIAEFSQDFQERIRRETEKFRHLSVREREGKQLLESLLGREIPLVLDPTFLLTKEEWTELEKKYPTAEEGYILYYTVFSSRRLFRFCLDLAEKSNKKVVIVGGNPLRQLRNKNAAVRYAWDLAPEEWLYLLHHASCVVTNSFHGTAFSIHYEKDFYLEYSSDTNSRLEQIVRISGLENRVVGADGDAAEEPIDYVTVNRRLAEMREQSLSYLKESLE